MIYDTLVLLCGLVVVSLIESPKGQIAIYVLGRLLILTLSRSSNANPSGHEIFGDFDCPTAPLGARNDEYLCLQSCPSLHATSASSSAFLSFIPLAIFFPIS